MNKEIVEIQSTLDATDQLIEWLVQDEDRLYDDGFMGKLSQLRQKHKKTLTIIEKLHKRERSQSAAGHYDREESMDDLYKSVINGKQYFDFNLDNDRENEDAGSIAESYFSDAYYPKLRSARSVDETIRELERAAATCDCDCWTCTTTEEEETFEFNGSKWTAEVTVPQPFKMTIRDETAPIKANYSQKFVQSLMNKMDAEKTEDEQRIAQNRFKAKPPPATTYLPIYQELQEKNEERRRFLRDNASEILDTKLAPFPLTTATKYGGSHVRRCESADNLNSKRRSDFRAKPVPPNVLSAKSAEMNNEKKLQAREQRARELLAAATPPPSLEKHIKENHSRRVHRHGSRCREKFTFAPKISGEVPNFNVMHRRSAKRLEVAKLEARPATVVEPFKLLSEHLKRHNCHKEQVKKHHEAIRRRRSSSVDGRRSMVTGTIRTNTAAVLRTEAIREHLEGIEAKALELMRFWERKQSNQQEFRARLLKKNYTQEYDAKKQFKMALRAKREALQMLTSEYQTKIAEIKERLRKQPTIIERQEMLVKRQSLEKKYLDALKAAGVKSMPSRARSSDQPPKAADSPVRKASQLSAVSSVKSIKAGEKSPESSKNSSKSSKSSSKSDRTFDKAEPEQRDEEIAGQNAKDYRQEIFEDDESNESSSSSKSSSSSSETTSSEESSETETSEEEGSKLSKISEKTEKSSSSTIEGSSNK